VAPAGWHTSLPAGRRWPEAALGGSAGVGHATPACASRTPACVGALRAARPAPASSRRLPAAHARPLLPCCRISATGRRGGLLPPLR